MAVAVVAVVVMAIMVQTVGIALGMVTLRLLIAVGTNMMAVVMAKIMGGGHGRCVDAYDKHEYDNAGDVDGPGTPA
eukprot:373895-Lingulodinium_polyedra.AAC.1